MSKHVPKINLDFDEGGASVDFSKFHKCGSTLLRADFLKDLSVAFAEEYHNLIDGEDFLTDLDPKHKNFKKLI